MENLLPLTTGSIPDRSVLTAVYTCQHCNKKLNGMIQYYAHVAHYHDTTRPLMVGKKARRQPLASELLDAMARAKAGITRAARELNVSRPYFVKWAEILIPEEWAEYKTRGLKGIGIKKGSVDIAKSAAYKRFLSVLNGTTPAPERWSKYPQKRMQKLQRYGLLNDTCDLCEFSERRISDYKSPILIDFKNGDQTNWTYDNIQMLCYNCYFLNVKDLWGRSKYTALGKDEKKYTEMKY